MLIAIDYETCDDRGASFEYFRKDFRVFSLSCAWRDNDNNIQQWFSTNPAKIRQKLADLARKKHPIVAHNQGFELGVTNACYPNIKLNWYADTMRLSQIRDGGGDEFNPPELSFEQSIAFEMGEMSEKEANKIRYKGIGLSLEACAARFLTDTSMHNHKSAAHDWLEENHGIKKHHGRYLDLLPHNLLEQYNNADTLVTLLIYEEQLRWAKEHSIKWEKDHRLYFNRGELLTGAYQRGIKINQEALMAYILKVEDEIRDIEKEFFATFKTELEEVEYIRFKRFGEKFANDNSLKTDKSRYNRWIKILDGSKDKDWKLFNIGSSLQLQILFMEVLEFTPKFLTKKGSPSFKTTHLHQWGKGGEILRTRKKRMLVLQQCVNTYIGALYDGRIHCSVKVAGTRTNRVAGGRM